MTRIHTYLIFLIVILSLASCGGDSVKTEVDSYPEIPDFPKFKDSVFSALRVATMKVRLTKDFKNQDHNDYVFRYLIKDSTLFIVTTQNDDKGYDNPLDDENKIDLLVIKGDQIVASAIWNDLAYLNAVDIDQSENLLIGQRKYLSKNNYSTFEAVKTVMRIDPPTDTLFKFWRQDDPITAVAFTSFDRVTIGSGLGLSGTANAPLSVGFKSSAVPMIYYQLDYDFRKGRTKINYMKQGSPLFLTLGSQLYYVTYTEKRADSENALRSYKVYKILKQNE